ncbi:PREDICTED: wings apart-like protein homolog, partial [Priapulus caudatus]|uniref:Wings apart-like protein homolog n=1 Tax=Priapulus caudatus TaxID=37621 RepID=A0ABM1F6X0_PRICU
MFILSRDRLTMDLDTATLSQMLALLDSDTRHGDGGGEATREGGRGGAAYERVRGKVRELCGMMQRGGHVKHLDLDRISTSYIAMETLLGLTSRKAGEWFKTELRTLGGLDHIITTMSSCADFLDDECEEPSDLQIEKIRKIDRCMRVLENVSYMNTENQQYVICFKQNMLILAMTRVLGQCQRCIESVGEHDSQASEYRASNGAAIFDCLLSVLRVFLNITHDNEVGSIKVGQQTGLIKTLLLCVLQVPQYVPTDKRFDLLVL